MVSMWYELYRKMEVTSNWSGGCFYGFETVFSSMHDTGKYSIQLRCLVHQLKNSRLAPDSFLWRKGSPVQYFTADVSLTNVVTDAPVGHVIFPKLASYVDVPVPLRNSRKWQALGRKKSFEPSNVSVRSWTTSELRALSFASDQRGCWSPHWIPHISLVQYLKSMRNAVLPMCMTFNSHVCIPSILLFVFYSSPG